MKKRYKASKANGFQAARHVLQLFMWLTTSTLRSIERAQAPDEDQEAAVKATGADPSLSFLVLRSPTWQI